MRKQEITPPSVRKPTVQIIGPTGQAVRYPMFPQRRRTAKP